jgi:hypothetical protein
MKTKQQEQALKLYLQKSLSKTEIAETLGVNRRTVYQWSVDGDWDTLRMSARCMPSYLAQKCYYIIGHFTDHLLQRDSAYRTVSKEDVYILSKLVTTVNKLKTGATPSESMENFTLFLEGVKHQDPDLADRVQPYVGQYIHAGVSMQQNTMLLHGMDEDGGMPFPEKEIMERWQDEKDRVAIIAEMNGQAPPPPDAPLPPSPDPTDNKPRPSGAPRHSFNAQAAAAARETNARPLYPVPAATAATTAKTTGSPAKARNTQPETLSPDGRFSGDLVAAAMV